MAKIFKIEAPEVEMVGRLVGFVDDKECTALINSDDAPKKVFTSESTTIKEAVGHMSAKRFVIAVRDNKENISPSLFISPKIKLIMWHGSIPELKCENGKSYKFTETE